MSNDNDISFSDEYNQGCQMGHFCGQIKFINRSFAAYGRRPQHFGGHKEDICGLWPPYFVVAEGHNICKVTGVRNSDKPGNNPM